MLKMYFIGMMVLLIAILANALAGVLGVISWYDAILSLQKNGAAALKQWKLMDYVWLFAAYPMILGTGGLMGMKLYELMVK